MSPRSDVSAERKAQIVDAAMRVFSRQGFDGASMDDIVAESSLSKGAIYWYYKSKDDIIIAILERLFSPSMEALGDMPDADTSASVRLHELVQRVVAEIDRFLLLMPITYEFYALAFRHDPVRQALRRYLERYLSVIEAIIKQGIAQGEFRAVDARAAAVAMSAVIEGTILLWVYDPEAISPGQDIQTGFRLLLQGLQP